MLMYKLPDASSQFKDFTISVIQCSSKTAMHNGLSHNDLRRFMVYHNSPLQNPPGSPSICTWLETLYM